MSDALKLSLEIIHPRSFNTCGMNIEQDQFRSRKEVGATEALLSLQLLAHKCKDHQKSIHICFMDYRVNHVQLLQSHQGLGLNFKDLRLLKSLY